MKTNKKLASRAIMMATALAGSVALASITFDAKADESGANRNDRKSVTNSQGQFDCKCNDSGTNCRCMVS